MKAVKIAGLLFLITSTSFAGNLGHGISYSIDKIANWSDASTISYYVKNSSNVEYLKIELRVTAHTTSGKQTKNDMVFYLKPNESTITSVTVDGKNPTDIKVSLREAYIEDKSLIGKAKKAIKHQKIRWFGFSLQ